MSWKDAVEQLNKRKQSAYRMGGEERARPRKDNHPRTIGHFLHYVFKSIDLPITTAEEVMARDQENKTQADHPP